MPLKTEKKLDRTVNPRNDPEMNYFKVSVAWDLDSSGSRILKCVSDMKTSDRKEALEKIRDIAEKGIKEYE